MKRRGQVIYPLADRLARMAVADERTGCINWTGTKSNGYGKMIVGSRTDGTRKTRGAHQVAYEVHKGPIPDGMEICHSCDNRACINPKHLFVGTRQDNVDDREAKGRNKVRRGSENTSSKLTESLVQSIRAAKAAGETTVSIAKKFGMHRCSIRRAISGQTWAHVKKSNKEQA